MEGEGASDVKTSPKSSEEEMKKTEEDPKALSLPLYNIFSFADDLDWLLIFVGTLGAVGTGLILPLYMILFSRVVNEIGLKTDAVPQVCSHLD